MLRFGAGIFYITGNSPLTLTRTELEALPGAYRYRRGLTFIGNGRGSTVLQLKTAGTGDLWFYSNYDSAYPGDMSAMDSMTFSGITFRGTEVNYSQSTGNKTNGFYWESNGWEKRVHFNDCDFEYLDTAFEISGYGNADLNKWSGCLFKEIRECIFNIDNNQSVGNGLVNCDVQNAHGDVFRIGSTGGGDITWTGGSIVMEPELDSGGTPLVSQREKAFLYWDNSGVTSGSSLGLGNGKFRFMGLRFEIYDPSNGIVVTKRSDSTPYGLIEPTFTDCSFFNVYEYPGSAPTTDFPLIQIEAPANVVFLRCNLASAITYAITKFNSTIDFRDCWYANEIPMAAPYDLLSGKCSVSSLATVTCTGLRTQKEITLGSYSVITAPDFTKGYDYLPHVSKYFNAKHLLQGWPQQGLTGPASVYLPAGSKVVSITLYKPAEAIASPLPNYGLYVRDYTGTSITPDDIGAEDREVSVKWELDAPFVVPAAPNNYIVLAATATLSTTQFTDTSGMFLVEYF